ncbi:hypothetical protein D9757_003634 [Collybiopsis confluens]|uniref:Uncharacterized protein n=1 Tax=Collybiopsis confluens TaxID=2823264 RepID=A0A8H5MDQ0_9AGAR|nr:hypothetical protein D9757_003634 [Collybiopsis confluens]
MPKDIVSPWGSEAVMGGPDDQLVVEALPRRKDDTNDLTFNLRPQTRSCIVDLRFALQGKARTR